MAQQFPNGTVFGFSTVMGTPVPMTAITNGDPPAATLGAATILAGDVLVVKSGWPLLNDRVAVAGTEDAGGSLPLIGLDTTEVKDYPAGEGAGQVIPASGFIDLSQQGNPTMSGGEPNFYTGQYLEDRTNTQFEVATFRTPLRITIPLDHDDKLPWYAALRAADRRREPVVLRAKLPLGATLYYYAGVSFQPLPTMEMNTPMQNSVVFSLKGDFTRVEAA